MMALETDRLTVSSRLKEISLRIVPGALTGIIGPNGAGKTTLIRCLAGEITPTSGRCSLEGNPLHRFPTRQLSQQLAYLPQQTAFTFPFTASELVGLQSASPQSLSAALEALGLDDLKDTSLLRLSGGERQRAAIARVLAQDTPILLLDEPLAQLDLRHQLQLLALLKQRSLNGITVVAVLHDLRLALRWCDQLVLLDQGTLVVQGAPTMVLAPHCLRNVFGVTFEALG